MSLGLAALLLRTSGNDVRAPPGANREPVLIGEPMIGPRRALSHCQRAFPPVRGHGSALRVAHALGGGAGAVTHPSQPLAVVSHRAMSHKNTAWSPLAMKPRGECFAI